MAHYRPVACRIDETPALYLLGSGSVNPQNRSIMIDAATYDWTRFEIDFYYDQPIGEVFRAWTTASGMESFFIQAAEYRAPDGTVRDKSAMVQPGDAYTWRWRHGYEIDGSILAMEPHRLLSFTFGSMRVDVQFAVVDSQTEVRLVQTLIDDSSEGRVLGHLNCRSCWVFFMTNLKSVLASQLDLRDSDPERVSCIEVGYEAQSLGGSTTVSN